MNAGSTNPSGARSSRSRDRGDVPYILFVGHEATRTGAPLILLHFLRWFSREVRWPFEIVLLRGGDLVGEFAELGPTFVLEDGARKFLAAVCRRLEYHRLGSSLQRFFLSRRIRRAPDLVYCNSVASAPVVARLPRLGCPLVCHVHELAFNFATTIEHSDKVALLNAADRYVACSEAVAVHLREQERVRPEKIDVIHGFLVPGTSNGAREGDAAIAGRVEAGTVVVGGVGTIGWRKGTDLFVQLALEVRRKSKGQRVRFVWVGATEDEDAQRMRHDVRVAGLGDDITIVEQVADPGRWYDRMDVFVLPSREDPYPLVVLEAADHGKPIVCFDRAGGAPELVEGDAGFVVPYLDVERMAGRVQQLVEDPDLRARMGAAARRKVRARHTLEATGPRIVSAMERAIREGDWKRRAGGDQ